MSTKKLTYVKIAGTMVNVTLKIRNHRVEAFPSNTYHVFEMENGTELWFNDFGVRTLCFGDTMEQLQ